MFRIKTREEKQYELEQKRKKARKVILDFLDSNDINSHPDITLLEIESLLEIILDKATRLQFQYDIGGHITTTEDVPTNEISWTKGVKSIDIRLCEKFTIHGVSTTENLGDGGCELTKSTDGKILLRVTNYWSYGSHTCSVMVTF